MADKTNMSKDRTLEILVGNVDKPLEEVQTALESLGYTVTDYGRITSVIDEDSGKSKQVKRGIVLEGLKAYFSVLEESSEVDSPLPVSSLGDPTTGPNLVEKDYDITGELTEANIVNTRDLPEVKDIEPAEIISKPKMVPPPLKKELVEPKGIKEGGDDLKSESDWFVPEDQEPISAEQTNEWAEKVAGGLSLTKKVMLTTAVLGGLIGTYFLGNYIGTTHTEKAYDITVSQLEEDSERKDNRLRKKAKEIRSLREEKSDLEDNLQGLKTYTSNLELFNDDFFAGHLALLNGYEKIESQLNSYALANQNLSKLLDQKKIELGELNTNYDIAAKGLLELQDQLAESPVNNYSELSEENERLNNLLSKSEKEVEELSEDLSFLYTKLLDLDERHSELKECSESVGLQNYIDELENALEMYGLENNSLGEENTQLSEQLSIANAFLTQSENDSRLFQEDLATVSEGFNTFQSSYDSLEEKRDELKTKLAETKELLASTQRDAEIVNVLYTTDLSWREFENVTLTEENSLLLGDKNSCQREVSELSKLSGKDDELTKLTREYSELTQNCSELRNACKKLETEHLALSGSEAELQTQFVVNPYQQIQGILDGPETKRSGKLKDLVVNYLKHRTVDKTIIVDGNNCDVALGNLYDTIVGAPGDLDKATRASFRSYTQRICGNIDPEKGQVKFSLKK
jgi:hypothetical protein